MYKGAGSGAENVYKGGGVLGQRMCIRGAESGGRECV